MLLSSFIFLHRPIQGFQILDQKVTLKFQFDLYSSRLVHALEKKTAHLGLTVRVKKYDFFRKTKKKLIETKSKGDRK